ncbi:DCC1 [Sanghuangporus sanghuang]
MSEYTLHFSSKRGSDDGQYKLMELPKELVHLIEKETQDQFTIRGRDDDDAVLCTADKTYNIRAVMVSNSFCVLTPPNGDEPGDAVIRATIDHILELSPSIAKLHRLRGMLRGCEYDEDSDGRGDRERRMLKVVKSELQASDAELEAGLRDMRVLVLNGELRPMTPGYLNHVLELILNTLVSLSRSTDGAPVLDIIETIQSDHEISPDVSRQVMSWFGRIDSSLSTETWTMDVDAVVRQIGIGILSACRSSSIEQSEFMKRWRATVGDSFENRISLSLLQGNYILTDQSATTSPALSYFPSSELPLSPADRFAELFLVQPKWKAANIVPFLDDIVVDSKDRDKLLMKFARSITDKDGVTYYTSRGGTIA